ncbi:tetratricopeptide repeat protein [Patulibacter defluvii]|uniref:tetratricopeptide repeat protein n=1 Tax=Patulibacter defluvii TaxID=3095358 RepID=UPI002A749230|nr:tetratricopeptide repeat protein [Patulibacter sp. DM4]
MTARSAAQLFRSAAHAAERGDLLVAADLAAASAERFGRSPDGANARTLAARCLQARGRYADAHDHVARGLDALAAVVAPDPAIARVRAALVVTGASIAVDRGHYAEAVAAVEALLRDAPDGDPADRFAAATTGGVAAKALGRHDRAAAFYRIAEAALRTGALGGEARAVLDHNLGGLAHARGDLETARRHAEAALAWRQAAAGDRPHDRAVAVERAALAAILIDAGECVAAVALLDAALASFAITGTDDPLDVGAAQHNLAEGLRRLGDDRGAARAYEAAVRAKSAALGPAHPEVRLSREARDAHRARRAGG